MTNAPNPSLSVEEKAISEIRAILQEWMCVGMEIEGLESELMLDSLVAAVRRDALLEAQRVTLNDCCDRWPCGGEPIRRLLEDAAAAGGEE